MLVLTLSTQVWAQEVSPALSRAVAEAHQQAKQQQSEIRPPISPTQKSLQGGNQSDWDALNQLQVGARIVVETIGNVGHHGRFVTYSDEAISLRKGRRELSYCRQQVLRVSRREVSKRWKPALIGAAIGFAIGAPIGAKVFTESGEKDNGVFILGLGFGALGAAVGHVVGRHSHTIIYRAPP